jgi:hypothetical protein
MLGSLNFVNDLVYSKPVFVTSLAENFASFCFFSLLFASLFMSFKMESFSSKHKLQRFDPLCTK